MLSAMCVAQIPGHTGFQTGHAYTPGLHVPADVAIVYGFGNDMPSRLNSWRNAGYEVQLMTGIAWGEYQDYLYGRFDGKNHEDEAQTTKSGHRISHGGDVYYMSPGPTYGEFLAQGVDKALKQGASAIYLEEPEFWVDAGWEPAFRREWKQMYGEDWEPPDSSPEAQWRASKLKYFLYRRALQQVFDSVQGFAAARRAPRVKCLVATHSLLNYASWHIVSPESSLAKLEGCDGYIAQVWTGTARTPNYCEGIQKERTFDTAFLEYGAMMNLARATGKQMWFLADPVEDDPKHDWGDYKRNYEATVAASLFQPAVNHYEVMPWPERVFGDKYPSEETKANKTLIPPAYATELQLVLNALARMKPGGKWLTRDPRIGVVVSDTLMFERSGPQPSDYDLSHFYGLALPFLERGIPVEPVQLETATAKELRRYRLLLMSYRGMKPMGARADLPIARWVQNGGRVLFVDDDGDPFNGIREWWNSNGFHYATPRDHLFEQPRGKGEILLLRRDPSQLAKTKGGSEIVWQAAKSLLGNHLRSSDSMILGRGPYKVAAGITRTKIKGAYVNLFDPNLSVLDNPQVEPRTRLLLREIPSQSNETQLLACAGKVRKIDSHEITIEGIEASKGICLFKCPHKPKQVFLGEDHTMNWDPKHQLLWIRFMNRAKPVRLGVVY